MHPLEAALFDAIRVNNREEVARLINNINLSSMRDEGSEQKANLFTFNDDQQTFLHYALEHKAYDAFDLLLPYFIDQTDLLLACDKKGRSVFMMAVINGKINLAKIILSCYPNKQLMLKEWLKRDSDGVTLLDRELALAWKKIMKYFHG